MKTTLKSILCASTFVMLLGLPGHSFSANIILNGDFEINSTVGVSVYNMDNALFNTTVASATAFGGAQEIDLITAGSPYGLAPESGNWKLAIHRSSSGENDAFSFTLGSAIVAGQNYILDFYAQRVITFDAGNGAIQIGVSSSPTSFGTLVFSGVADSDAWTHFNQAFQSPVNGQYLTVQTDPNAAPTWNHLDNFSLTEVPEPAALSLFAAGVAATLARRRTKLP